MTPLIVLLLGVVAAAPADLTPAWEALRAGDVAAAHTAFEQALLALPEQVEALNGMGFIALREGKTEDAGRYFARALARSAGDRDALVGQALVDERSGAPEVALGRIEAVLETYPADEEAKAVRTRLEAGLPPRPEAEFKQGRPDPLDLVHGAWVELPDDHDFADLDFIESDRSEIQRVVDLLHGVTILGREWEPLRLYQWKTWDEPTHPPFEKLSYRIVRTSLRSGAPFGSAARRLKEARAAQDAGKLEEGIRLYRDLIDDPDPTVQGTALLGLALLESWRGNYGDAVTHYRMARDRFPERRKAAIRGAALTLGWARRYPEALMELDQNLEDYPDDKAEILLEGQVAGWGGMIDRSMAAFHRVLEIDPEDQSAQRGLAKVLAWSGRLPESEVEFKKFLSEHPDDASGLLGITYTLMWQGRPHEAETWFGRIGRESEGSKDYRIAETALHWALGERALARQHLRELMWQFPGEPDTRDLWRAQAGVVGPFTRTEPTVLRDVEGLRVETLRLEAAAPLAAPGFVFGEGRQEWLERNGDAVGVKGGRMGVDWVFGRRWRGRGSLGVRRSDVDTGGWTGGGTLSSMARPDRGFSASVDSDFAFYTPVAVRSDVRMTDLTLAAWTALTSRLSVSGAYSRTHFGASEASPHPELDQNRDALTVKARHNLLGYKTNRVDAGAIGYFFRFDRTFNAGYWNPQRFRQVMGTVAVTQHRSGELWTVILEGGLGVQSQDDQPWGPAASGHIEFLRQLRRRMDLTGRLSYGNSGFARQTGSTGYWNWSAALGVQVRLGNRNLRGPLEVPEDTRSPIF